jgi:hypothetical protein
MTGLPHFQLAPTFPHLGRAGLIGHLPATVWLG